ncbi:ATP-binding protein [Chelatococcus sp. GCM10030263]|uniref:ATP-binding protein n=1 Tax=Chelatococcus sp. GCM10030263 TaxID=3273387 RepID=UPI00360A59D1
MTWRFMSSFGPRHIAGQIILLVVSSVVVFHVITLLAIRLTTDLPARPDRPPPAVIDRFADFVRLLDRLPPADRPEIVAAIRETHPSLALTLHPSDAALADARPTSPAIATGNDGLDHLRRALGPELTPVLVATAPTVGSGPQKGHEISVRLGDRSAVTGVIPSFGAPRLLRPWAVLIGTLVLITLILTALLWWATRGIMEPLAGLARAAEAFSLDRDPAPLSEEGPAEMKATARALNRMQDRICKLVEDRTRMLAAVSHDLRTPITRLRLRAEFVEDETVRTPMLRDLAQMGAMVDTALAYLRGGAAQRGRSLVDLASLLQTLCHDFADMGGKVFYEGPDHLLIEARVEEIQRAVTNLVENALKYGGRAAVLRLTKVSDGAVEIDVIDDGPGIADAQKASVMEPFARGDAARSMTAETSSFGLGLAIARSAAEIHGGRLTLHDVYTQGPRRGLCARLHLPLSAA